MYMVEDVAVIVLTISCTRFLIPLQAPKKTTHERINIQTTIYISRRKFRMYKMFYNLRIHAISCILFFLTFFRFVSSLYASSTGNRGIHYIYNYRYAFIICYIQRRKRKIFTAYHIRRTNQLYILFH